MASAVSICNLALIQVGAQTISAFTEQTREARLCNQIYEYSKDSVLRAHDWNFARCRVDLGLLATTFTNWSYTYAYPSDCLVARKIVNPLGSGNTQTYYDYEDETYRTTGQLPYDIMRTSTGSKVVVTNIADAELEYTARIDDANMFDSMFIDALILRLASDLASPLRADRRVAGDFYQKYQYTIREARTDNANEGVTPPDTYNGFVGSRN